MAIVLSDNIQTNAQSPTDSRYYNGLLPWASTAAVNAAIASGIRYTGLTVNILGIEYWYCGGISNGNLVVKSSGGQLNWTGSTANGLGTYVSSSYICSQPNLTFDGTKLNITGNIYASSCIKSPLISGNTVCATTCFIGSGAGLTGTAGSLKANDASCLGGNLANTYAPLASPNFTTCICTPVMCSTGQVKGTIITGSTCIESPVIQLTTGAAAGCVFTSNATGCGIWCTPASSGLAWSGSTANGVGTYVSASKICSNANMTFDGTKLGVTGNICASTCLCSPITIGTSCVCSPTVLGSTCVCGAIVCGSTCVTGAITCGTTCVQTALLCSTGQVKGTILTGSTCIISPILYGSTCSNSPLHCGACTLATTCVCSPIIIGSTCVCGGVVCATTVVTAACTIGTTCVCSPTVLGSTCVCGAIVCSNTCLMTGTYVCAGSSVLSGTFVCATSYVQSHSYICSETCIVASTCITGTVACFSTCAIIANNAIITATANPYIALCKSNATAHLWYLQASADVVGLGCTLANSLCIDTTGNAVTTANMTAACFVGILCGTACNAACLGGNLANTYAPIDSPSFTTILRLTAPAYICFISKTGGANNGAMILNNGTAANFWLGEIASNVYNFGGAYNACTLTLNTSTGLVTANGILCAITCGTSPDWIATSDCRLKKCIKPIMGALSTVLQLQGVSYELCDDESHENQIGLIAQDVKKILPAIVSHITPSEEDKKYGITDDKLGLKYDKLTAILIEAIKEQQKEIKDLDRKVHCLCNDLNYYINSNYKTQ